MQTAPLQAFAESTRNLARLSVLKILSFLSRLLILQSIPGDLKLKEPGLPCPSAEREDEGESGPERTERRKKNGEEKGCRY